eukprot:CAMPEP_0119373668 /NCGR_PEP_ID=MMETSP1334-20130426/26897_1 /TAXON_ID=127549 /ORGANISM="Calcidiscus leptoporus, Strain RCC1130" /LENGTH=769 /DNA_ID=CAMNT_0007391513 /DNA_START=37 /DNA_END=2343 /DNA_ORIENTATION=-
MAEQGIADAQCSHVHVWVEQRAASWPRSMCAHPLCLPASAVQHISTAQHSTVRCCTLRFRTPTLSLLALPWGPGAAIPFRDWNQASWPVAGLWFTVWFAKTECQDQTGVVYVSFNTKDSPQATHWCMPGAPFLLPAPAAVMGTRVGGDALAHPLSPRAMASYLNRSRSSPGRVPVAPRPADARHFTAPGRVPVAPRSTSESRPSHAPAASPVAPGRAVASRVACALLRTAFGTAVHPRLEVGRAVASGGGGAAEPRALLHRGVGEHKRCHALDQRRRARQHARVVAPLRLERHLIAFEGGRVLRLPDGGHRLDRHLEVDGRACRDAAQRAARVVGARGERRRVPLGERVAGGVARHEGVVVRRAAHRGAREAGAELEAFRRGEREHRVRELRLEAVKDRLAKRRRNTDAHARHAAADRVLLLLHLPDQRRHLASGRRVRAPEGKQLVRAPRLELRGHGVDDLALVVVQLARVVLVRRHQAQRGGLVAELLQEHLLGADLDHRLRSLPRIRVWLLKLRQLAPVPRLAQQAQRAQLVHLRARPAKPPVGRGGHRLLRDRVRPNRRHPARDGRPVSLVQPLLCNGPRRDAPDGLARRRAAAPGRRLGAVLDEVREVGVAGPRDGRHLLVVSRPLVLVLDKEADGGAKRVPVLGAGKDRHHVLLRARRGEATLAGAATGELRLDVRLGQREARRHAIHDRAYALAVRLSERGDAEDGAERGHLAQNHRRHTPRRSDAGGVLAWAVAAAIEVKTASRAAARPGHGPEIFELELL